MRRGRSPCRPPTLQFFFVKHLPFGRIVFDISPYFVVILRIADDMIVIGFLPEFFVEGDQNAGFDTATVVVGGHGFEILHHIWKGAANFLLRDRNDQVKMVGHDGVFIDADIGKMGLDFTDSLP